MWGKIEFLIYICVYISIYINLSTSLWCAPWHFSKKLRDLGLILRRRPRYFYEENLFAFQKNTRKARHSLPWFKPGREPWPSECIHYSLPIMFLLYRVHSAYIGRSFTFRVFVWTPHVVVNCRRTSSKLHLSIKSNIS